MSEAKPPQTARYREGAGYDHPHFEWSPWPKRAPLAWPDGSRLAYVVVLYLEYLELDPPTDAVRDPRYGGALGSYFPDYMNYSLREYGNRVGIFRVLELLDRYGLKATVAANAMACERYPYLVEQCLKRGYEMAAHGIAATRMITGRMTEAEERAHIAESVAAVEKATGTRPTGWIGQDFGESTRTPRLLAEAGLDWVMDWPNDDAPYPMTVGRGEAARPFVSLPHQAEWDDTQLLWLRRLPMPRFPEVVGEAFETLHEEGGRFFGLHLHPWLVGQANRIRYLDEALARLSKLDGVWQATAGEAAAWSGQSFAGQSA